jgi:hypothetical protein
MKRILFPLAAVVLCTGHLWARQTGGSWTQGATTQSTATSPLWKERERDLALVQHIQRHLKDPADGLALAADRRDLRRVVSGAARAASRAAVPGTQVTEDDLLAQLGIIAELWNLRVNDRTAFAMMPRERLELVDRVQATLTKLAGQVKGVDRDRVVPSLQHELDVLRLYGQGRGEIPERGIEMALVIADAASTGRPATSSMGYPAPVPPGSGPTAPPAGYPTPPPPATPPAPPGAYPPPPPAPPSGPRPPSQLPPGYAAYAGTFTLTCLTERNRAGDAGDSAMMLRVADCWAREHSWPGWGGQTIEAIDWAIELAYLDRDCAEIDSALNRLRTLGPGAGFLPAEGAKLPELARAGEEHKAWLRSHGGCKQ